MVLAVCYTIIAEFPECREALGHRLECNCVGWVSECVCLSLYVCVSV